MAEEPPNVVWAVDQRGNLNPYHEVCARQRKLTPSSEKGAYYHTAICQACARFLDSPPEPKEGSEAKAD